MNKYIEIRNEVKRLHSPRLVEYVGELGTYEANFRSVYLYDDEVKDYIERTGRTKGLKGCKVYSDVLFIDVDRDNKDVAKVEYSLRDKGIKYSRWYTGNRGAHLHVPVAMMEGSLVPESQAQWVKRNLPYELIDMSIYRTSGQIRLPGAMHQKTGREKKLLVNVPGDNLLIPVLTSPPPSAGTGVVSKATPASYLGNMTKYRESGQRHTHIMIIVKEGLSLGYNMDRIKRDVMWWNLRFTEQPLDITALLNHVDHTMYYCKGGEE